MACTNTTGSRDHIDLDVSGELFENESLSEHCNEPAELNFTMSTKTKEPSVPPTSPEMLQLLKDLQRFDNPEWVNVRYADIQKLYSQSPGFVNLEANDEVRRLDVSKNTANMEKAFASITFALLKQRDALQKDMQELLNYAHQNQPLEYKDLHAKISGIFSDGNYCKTTADALQLVCGHRSELVQHRREAILAAVKDPYHKSALRKIPPSCSHLFDADKFSAVLEKSGGVKKVFWCNEKDRYPAPQNDQKNPVQIQNKNTGKSGYKDLRSGPKNNVNSNFRGRGTKRRPPTREVSYRNTADRRSPSSHRDRRGQTRRKY